MTRTPPAGDGPDDDALEELIDLEQRWFVLGRSSNAVVRTVWKAGVFVVGWAVVVVGIVLIPLPGPGWLVVFAGLAILATEFAWARRLLRWAKAQLERARDKASDVNDRRQRRKRDRTHR